MSTDRILTFGEFRLDPASGQLYRGAAAVPLTPKAFALLQYLVDHAGRLVTKAELLERVWPDVFVGDAVLKSSIRELRKALGDDSQPPALHRDRASPRLSLHRAGGAARADRTPPVTRAAEGAATPTAAT